MYFTHPVVVLDALICRRTTTVARHCDDGKPPQDIRWCRYGEKNEFKIIIIKAPTLFSAAVAPLHVLRT